MNPIFESILASAASVICMIIIYREGFKKGVKVGATPDIDFQKNIKLPTSDEIMAAANSRHWDDKITKQVFKL